MDVTKIGVIDRAVLVAKKATMTFGTQIATIKTSEKVAKKATIRKEGKQMIKYYDAQSWLREKESRRLKFPAVLFAFAGTVVTCLLAGMVVGVFFGNIFWFCAIGIAVIALPYVLMDNRHDEPHERDDHDAV
jgi:hypothetical protein